MFKCGYTQLAKKGKEEGKPDDHCFTIVKTSLKENIAKFTQSEKQKEVTHKDDPKNQINDYYLWVRKLTEEIKEVLFENFMENVKKEKCKFFKTIGKAFSMPI